MLEKEVKKEVADMAEVVKVVQELQNRVEVLKAQLNESASDAEAKKVDVDVDPWKFWDQWSEDSSDETFLGFVDDGMPQNLVAGKTYGFEIGPVALVGDCLQMLVMILDATEDGCYVYEDRPVGLLLECYKLGSEEFKEMARGIYAGGYKTIIDVHIDRIGEAYGTIEVKEKDGKFADFERLGRALSIVLFGDDKEFLQTYEQQRGVHFVEHDRPHVEYGFVEDIVVPGMRKLVKIDYKPWTIDANS